jgi:hypothetical protein
MKSLESQVEQRYKIDNRILYLCIRPRLERILRRRDGADRWRKMVEGMMTKADVQYRIGRGLAGMVAGTLRFGEMCVAMNDLNKARATAMKALDLLRQFPQIPARKAEMLRGRLRRLELLTNERDRAVVEVVVRTGGAEESGGGGVK